MGLKWIAPGPPDTGRSKQSPLLALARPNYLIEYEAAPVNSRGS